MPARKDLFDICQIISLLAQRLLAAELALATLDA